ncbi:MAG TPA: glycoside hydrolase family 15 protein [Gaiellaceae bacterium]|nr:glycoside hydrolase family 15 protein [Gaiellaceae bacterium]
MNPGPAAILGNGSLLATMSARGQVERLFWPSLDRGSHLGDLRFGLELDGAVEQSYLLDANVLLSRSRDIEVVDLVPELEPVLLRRIRGRAEGGRLVVDCRPELDGISGGLAASVDGNRVVFYRRDVALAVGAVGAEAFATGLGETQGGISVPFDGDAVVALAFGASSREAVARLDAALQQDFDALVSSRIRYDAARIARAEPPHGDEVAPLYRRSLLALELLADRDSGSVIAAPELDPQFEHSGGYGFVWGRDLAFIVLAFLAAGRDDLAKRALRWLPTAQEPEGLWLQRHWTNGSLAPSWCRHQLDETGAILFAYDAAWRRFGDETLDADLWPSARRAADFLLGTVDADGLPVATADLWEEREGRHAFTAAAIVGGLRAAASMARRHDPAFAEPYEAAAEVVREAIERELWSDFHGRYLRSLGDPVVDVSLLGLAWPFAAVEPGGERMRATVAALQAELGCPAGSLRRYAGDTYAGGNRWVLAGLWLGLWHRQAGEPEGLERALRYALGAQTDLGLLPEQVTDDGEPAWVVPLAWSHAMLLLAARPELEAVLNGWGQTPAVGVAAGTARV